MSGQSPMPWLKAVEVLVLLAAGIGFCWWQLRDAARERERSRQRREQQPPHADMPAATHSTQIPGAPEPAPESDNRPARKHAP